MQDENPYASEEIGEGVGRDPFIAFIVGAAKVAGMFVFIFIGLSIGYAAQYVALGFITVIRELFE